MHGGFQLRGSRREAHGRYGMVSPLRRDLIDADVLIKEAAVQTIENYRTVDIMAEGKTLVGCCEMGHRFLETLEKL